MAPRAESQPRPEQLALLSALADGTLDAWRRPHAEAAISDSPRLSALYARERSVVEILDRARVADRAPAHVRAVIKAQRSAKTPEESR
jgi:anti-sigma factor RsiW